MAPCWGQTETHKRVEPCNCRKLVILVLTLNGPRELGLGARLLLHGDVTAAADTPMPVLRHAGELSQVEARRVVDLQAGHAVAQCHLRNLR